MCFWETWNVFRLFLYAGGLGLSEGFTSSCLRFFCCSFCVKALFLFILVCHSTGFVFAVFLFAVVKYFYTMLRFLTHYSSVRLSHLTTRQLNIAEQGRRGGAKLGRMRGVMFAQTRQLSDDWEQRTKGKGAKQSIDPIMLALIPAVVLILPIIKLI